MKILLLAPPNNIHTIRWANGLQESGCQVILAGTTTYDRAHYHPAIKIISLGLADDLTRQASAFSGKWRYLGLIRSIKRTIVAEKIDILHAHYATSYGLLGALTGFHPFFISAWGSDIYKFPNQSYLHKQILRFNLSRADLILSTSEIMSRETRKYTSKRIGVVPFGIDTELFSPLPPSPPKNPDIFRIGIAKTLNDKYGISDMLKSFAMFKESHPEVQSACWIAGDGPLEETFRKEALDLGIADQTKFLGRLPHSQLPDFFRQLSVAVFPSQYESFGVSALEANACGIPVVVSDAPGFMEVVINQKTGIIVERNNVYKLYQAILSLYNEPEKRLVLGMQGRKNVIEKYEWKDNLATMLGYYKDTLSISKT